MEVSKIGLGEVKCCKNAAEVEATLLQIMRVDVADWDSIRRMVLCFFAGAVLCQE